MKRLINVLFGPPRLGWGLRKCILTALTRNDLSFIVSTFRAMAVSCSSCLNVHEFWRYVTCDITFVVRSQKIRRLSLLSSQAVQLLWGVP